MASFDIDIAAKVRENCLEDAIPLTEQVSSFLLGYHFERAGAEVAFQIDRIPMEEGEISFSPDIDVLKLEQDTAIGYEVKGVRGETNTVTKDQLYTGLGQAQLLLEQPIMWPRSTIPPRIQSAYLAIPAGRIAASEEWQEKFIDSVESMDSVGLVLIKRGEEPEVEVTANPRQPEEWRDLGGLARRVAKREQAEEFRTALDTKKTGKSVKNPQRSLEVLAERLARDEQMNVLSL